MRSVFKVRELEDGWDWNDLYEVDEMAEEYCLTALDIPSEYIHQIVLDDSGLHITLIKSKSYTLDDWYTNLCRIGEGYAQCA